MAEGPNRPCEATRCQCVKDCSDVLVWRFREGFGDGSAPRLGRYHVCTTIRWVVRAQLGWLVSGSAKAHVDGSHGNSMARLGQKLEIGAQWQERGRASAAAQVKARTVTQWRGSNHWIGMAQTGTMYICRSVRACDLCRFRTRSRAILQGVLLGLG